MKTLQKYLAENYANGVIDFHVRAFAPPGETPSVYLHPRDVDGETLDFLVDGNALTAKDRAGEFLDAAEIESEQSITARLRADPKLQAKLRRLLDWQEDSRHSQIVLGGDKA